MGSTQLHDETEELRVAHNVSSSQEMSEDIMVAVAPPDAVVTADKLLLQNTSSNSGNCTESGGVSSSEAISSDSTCDIANVSTPLKPTLASLLSAPLTRHSTNSFQNDDERIYLQVGSECSFNNICMIGRHC